MKLAKGLFGETFHTGLRKGSDSNYSSFLWNLISVMPNTVYSDWCNHMEAKLAKIEGVKGVTAAQFKECAVTWDYEAAYGRLHPDPRQDKTDDGRWCIIWRETLAMTPHEEWENSVVWIKYCFDVWRGKD